MSFRFLSIPETILKFCFHFSPFSLFPLQCWLFRCWPFTTWRHRPPTFYNYFWRYRLFNRCASWSWLFLLPIPTFPFHDATDYFFFDYTDYCFLIFLFKNLRALFSSCRFCRFQCRAIKSDGMFSAGLSVMPAHCSRTTVRYTASCHLFCHVL